jgi:hypothetical protein
VSEPGKIAADYTEAESRIVKQLVDERGIKPSNENSGRFTSLHAVYIFHGSCRFPVLKFIGLSHISVLLFDWWWT